MKPQNANFTPILVFGASASFETETGDVINSRRQHSLEFDR